MMMTRNVHISVTVALLLSITAPLHAATPKAGAKCTKAGVTATSGGKKFTCIKSGTKLVWNKGVAVKAAAKPTPTPTSANEKPFSPPLAPTSFEDLPSRIDGIIYGAWLQASQQIQKSSSQLGVINMLVGPNTVPNDAKSIDSLSLISKLYSNSPQVKNLYVINIPKTISHGPNNNMICFARIIIVQTLPQVIAFKQEVAVAAWQELMHLATA